ncbi:N-acetylglucosamine-6-phosphate deacetylase [Eubacteriales bacterium OttesenSCG-928-K08]|nr:N-acetylglucosamine-6-phosphate deacetylase [Eubacteriales bacterium OttesenSCG-928-K08]
MATLFTNAKLLLEDCEQYGWLLVEGEKIAALGNMETMPVAPHAKRVDVRGAYLSPGWIDLHVHGGGGHDFMDATPEAIEGAAKFHLKHGTTTLLPTTVACSDEEYIRLLSCFREVKLTMQHGPNMPGLHLEGPYIATEHAGAQDMRYIRVPEQAHIKKLLDAGGADIARMTAAVELDGAFILGDMLKQRGIIGSIGHSGATFDQVKEGLRHGFTHVTHFYSTMSTIRRVNAYRVLGVVESPYLLNDLTVEIIADGSHLPKELLQLITGHIAHNRISLITDAMRGAGLPEGSEILLGSSENGQLAIVKDSVAFLPDFTAFAGSVCTADRCILTMRDMVGIPLYQAVALMSSSPAAVLGIARQKGKLSPGYDADLLVFDHNIQMNQVWVMGKQAY